MVDDTQEEKVQETKKEEVKEKPLDKMTAPELRAIAREIPGVEGVHAMKKEQLLQTVKEARGIEEEEPVKKKAKKAPKKEVTVKALKGKIIRLKTEKEKAHGAQDKKKVAIYRRRINRLKKQTRKVAQV